MRQCGLLPIPVEQWEVQYRETEHIPVAGKTRVLLHEGILGCTWQFTFPETVHESLLQKKIVIVKEKKNLAESSAHCRSLGGSLALPESSEEENQRITHELSKTLKVSLRFPHSFAVDSWVT